MSNWGNALAGAVGAVANDGAQALGAQMQDSVRADAEQRAADLQLNLHQRMAAADEMMKNRAAERFAALTKQKMAEPVAVDPSSIKNPTLTDASAVDITPRGAGGSAPAAGDDDEEDGTDTSAPAGAGGTVRVALHGDQSATLKQMQAVVDNPKATPEQKQDAQNVIDGISAQIKKQQQLDASGKTRSRTVTEARDAALEDAAQNDPSAYIAGQSMWKQAMADERSDDTEKKSAAEKAADRASREKIAGMNVDQRRQASADRMASAQARIEALAGGKGAKATALMQNYNFMTTTMGKSPEEAQRLLFQAKDSSELEKVFKLLMHDKYGEMSTDDALAKVRGVEKATGATPPAKLAAGQVPTGGRVRTWNPATGKLE